MEAEDGESIYTIDRNERNVRRENLRSSMDKKIIVEDLPDIPHADATIASRVKLAWYGEDIGIRHGGCMYETTSRHGKPIVMVAFCAYRDFPQLQRIFSLFKYKTMDTARQAARLFRGEESMRRGATKNVHRHVWTEDETEYFQVDIYGGESFICSLGALELVESQTWSKDGRGYIYGSSTGTYFHIQRSGYKVTDHINGDISDNRDENLRDGSTVNPRNLKVSSRNKSG